ERYARDRYAAQCRRVELLEARQRAGNGSCLKADDSRERQRTAVGCRDVVVFELAGVQPRLLRDLGNHAIGAAGEAEIVDVVSAEHRAERAADVAHGEAELRGLVAVDRDLDLRLVEAQIV